MIRSHVAKLAVTLISVLLWIGNVRAAPIAITCVADAPGKSAIDGCGYDYKNLEYVELPATQAWSKMYLSFDSLPAPKAVELSIFGWLLPEIENKHSAQVLSADDYRITFFYEVSRNDSKSTAHRESWMLTYFPQSQTLYFSAHEFDNSDVAYYNVAARLRGQIFKARCYPGRK